MGASAVAQRNTFRPARRRRAMLTKITGSALHRPRGNESALTVRIGTPGAAQIFLGFLVSRNTSRLENKGFLDVFDGSSKPRPGAVFPPWGAKKMFKMLKLNFKFKSQSNEVHAHIASLARTAQDFQCPPCDLLDA